MELEEQLTTTRRVLEGRARAAEAAASESSAQVQQHESQLTVMQRELQSLQERWESARAAQASAEAVAESIASERAKSKHRAARIADLEANMSVMEEQKTQVDNQVLGARLSCPHHTVLTLPIASSVLRCGVWHLLRRVKHASSGK